MRRLKRIGIDLLGVLLIIGSVLFGWLPGPGGIPMFLAGLRLLAINHKWAQTLFDFIKTRGLRFIGRFFTEHPLLMLAYDVFAIFLLAGATAVFILWSGNIVQGLAIVTGFVGLGIFLGNRRRLQRLVRKIKRSQS